VVDHYGLDARWQKTVAQDPVGVLVIDDLANRSHDCAVLTDAGRPASAWEEYADITPTECSFLLGPKYALLRRDFRNAPAAKPEREQPNLLIFFGSEDGQGLTERALDALGSANLLDELTVHVVLTSTNRQAAAIRQRDGIEVHEDVADMPALIAGMDIALGAGGVSLWERCSLGVPGLVVGLNENQIPGVQLAEAAGAIRSIGLSDVRQPNVFAETIRQFVADRDHWRAMASAGRELVDGRGADRIVAHMGALELRVANPDDSELLWRWANDPDVRAMAFNTDPISFEDHQAWFASKIHSSSSLILLAAQAGAPVGQVRFDAGGDDGDVRSWVIDISLAPEYRGRKLALEVLQKALVLFRRAHRNAVAVAWVKSGNAPSAKLFEAAGFQSDGNRDDARRFVYR
jgi:spore coat polysaccharide biosynthesis predicted glycosyltransferase SpsG/RimJ/RimL family protein N-acetyltransferase